MHYPKDFVSILLFILFLLIKHDYYLSKKIFHTQFSDKCLLL
jgi:hypothetical protein